jgi:NAD(P)-dependent dehydrogenase (short-subunit alcohol dehydrogenase family)
MRRTIDVNPMDALPMAQEAVRRWQAADTRSRVVDVSSIAATLGSPREYVHYAATKAAIDALTIGLGKEVTAPGIRINAVAPGLYRNPCRRRYAGSSRLGRRAGANGLDRRTR